MIKQRRYRTPATPSTAAPGPETAEPATAAVDRPQTGPERGTAKGEVKGRELGQQIGHKLKAMFDDVVAEPVPEKFRDLLEELERKSGKP